MDPAIWGPKTWDVLFVAALNLDPSEVAPLVELYAECLPCVHCRRSFAVYRGQMPCESMSGSRDSLFKWVWAMHDMVNQKLGKPSLTMDRARRRYQSFSSYVSCTDVVDVLTCMTCCAHKEGNAAGLERVAQSMPEIRALLAHVLGGRAAARHVPTEAPSGATVVDEVLRLRAAVRRAFDLPPETRSEALLRFPAADPPPAAARVPRSARGVVSRTTGRDTPAVRRRRG